jgi:benzoylformate decarboxylase
LTHCTGTATDAILTVLRDRGVTQVFGNPGTMELPIYGTLGRYEIEHVLALQEIVAVSMAAGAAAARRSPSVVVIHTVAGLGNGMGALYGAARLELPVVALIGTQDARHELAGPTLSGDAAAMIRPVAKAVYDVRSAGEAAAAVSMAWTESMTPARGVCAVVLPADLLVTPGEFEIPAPVEVSPPRAGAGLAAIGQKLRESKRPVVVTGSEVAWSDAIAEAAAVAEAFDADVVSEPLGSFADFPSTHHRYRGALPANSRSVRKVLSNYDTVLLAGSRLGRWIPYSDVSPVPAGTTVLAVDSRPGAAAGRYQPQLCVIGAMRASLAELAGLAAGADARGTGDAAAAGEPRAYPGELGRVATALRAIKEVVPPETVVVSEASSMGGVVRDCLGVAAGRYYANGAGGLGFGPGFAAGIALADPSRPVIGVIGDGALMYAPQALWNGGRAGLRILYLILNNRAYQALRDGYRNLTKATGLDMAVAGTDLVDPGIDFVAIAHGHGVTGAVVKAPEQLAREVALWLRQAGPLLIDYQLV